MKYGIRLIILFLTAALIQFITGCGGADVEEESETTKLIKDSTSIYTSLESARLSYSKALQFNEQSDLKNSITEFEAALKSLNKIDSKTLKKHFIWENDYNELAKSIVQDYLTAISDIPSISKVFSMAEKLGVKYEKVEQKSYKTETFNPHELPEGEDIKLEKNSYVNE
jgi:hypothetical protein